MKKTDREYGDDDGYGDFRDDNPRRVDEAGMKQDGDQKKSGSNPKLGERPEAEKDKNIGNGTNTDITTGPQQKTPQQGTGMAQDR